MSAPVTEWFEGVNPVHSGDYERDWGGGRIYLDRFDGYYWFGSFQCLPWRGLADKPVTPPESKP